MTSEAKERPNFNIIEGHTVEINYEEFKDDFLNPYFLAEDVRKKYGLSPKQYKVYRKKVLNETGLTRKPTKTEYKLLERLPINTKSLCSEYIREYNGNYIIKKIINHKTKYYGRYEDYDTAVMVRDKLVKCDWDEEIARELVSVYGMKRLRPALEKAKELYEEYEFRYFYDRDTTVGNIKKEMGITQTIYSYLLMLLRANHGKDMDRWMYD